MLNPDDVLALTRDLESDLVERTVSTTDTKKFCEAVCAFANDFPRHRKPGYLMVGVRNDGSLNGLVVTDELLLNLGALRSDGNIRPLPAITVTKYTFPGGDVAVVQVQPSDLPPVRYRGRVWIRVGPQKATASEQEEKILTEYRVASARTFDAQPCTESTLQDLALSQFESYRQEAISTEIIEENHRTMEEQLSSLRFFSPQLGVPTNAGIILFGKNPRFFLPGSYIQFLLLPGTELTDVPEDQAEISGDLLGVMREIESRLRALIRHPMQAVSTLREEVSSEYPDAAIRELLINAIIHRTYESNTPVRFYWFSDRIEIHSPGGPYGEVTAGNFTTQSSYRNPILAEAMKTLGYVNRFGYGIQKAQRLLSENGNPPAEFEVLPHSVLAVIRRKTS